MTYVYKCVNIPCAEKRGDVGKEPRRLMLNRKVDERNDPAWCDGCGCEMEREVVQPFSFGFSP